MTAVCCQCGQPVTLQEASTTGCPTPACQRARTRDVIFADMRAAAQRGTLDIADLGIRAAWRQVPSRSQMPKEVADG